MTIREIAPALALLAVPGPAGAGLRVVTTTEGLAALAREVGGGRVEVTALARGNQDPHFVDANPTLAVKLRQAALLVDVGLDLEAGWLPPLVNQSRNADVQPGGKGRLTAASAVEVLDVPVGPVDRSQGDLHPAGNPHFLTDPRRAAQVAGAIAARLAALDPAGAQAYAAAAADFRRRVAAAEARWRGQLAPFAGARVFTHHRTLGYFAAFAGIVVAGYLEPKPGVSPPPSHIAQLVQQAKAEKVRAVLVESYYDPRSAAALERHAGTRTAVLPGDVGASRGATGWEAWMDEVVKAVAEALR